MDDGGQPIFLDTKDEGRVVVARAGDPLFTRFECGKCHFRNVQGRDPTPGDRSDVLINMCIRRASLDVFWSREAGTVRGSCAAMKAVFRLGQGGQDISLSWSVPSKGCGWDGIHCASALQDVGSGQAQSDPGKHKATV